MDKMVMVVIPRDEAEMVLDALISSGYTATFMETKGGMLRQSQYTLFIAVKNADLKKVCEIIKENCTVQISNMNGNLEREEMLTDESLSGDIGGAIIFIWNLNKVEIY
jgi:uncharacterized protein YaaQ